MANTKLDRIESAEIYPVFMDAYMERANQQPKQNPSEDRRTGQKSFHR